jgi:hypothetical protein
MPGPLQFLIWLIVIVVVVIILFALIRALIGAYKES